MSVRVLVVGSANVDYTVALARLPEPGETVTGGTLLVNHGGKGANQALAARRLGAEVRLIACVGEDTVGREIRQALAAEGVDVTGVASTAEAATGTALIVVDAEGRNQIAVAPGANRRLDVELVARRAADFEWADVLVCQLETPLPTVKWALEEGKRRGMITILNPAPVPDASIDVWPSVDYLTPNSGEAARLSGVSVGDRRSAAEAANTLRNYGVGTVVVTLGADGALCVSAAGSRQAPGFAVAVLDTTAAGDTFNAALAVTLAERTSLDEGLRFANAAAALACIRRGAQPSLPRRDEVVRLLGA
ncbi:MAG TPA: ribokinase [Candidatus Acidoferrum sp.]|nr:ribokinase [Candidatus Acidoferrum sp.]